MASILAVGIGVAAAAFVVSLHTHPTKNGTNLFTPDRVVQAWSHIGDPVGKSGLWGERSTKAASSQG